ncbi:sporulation-delaying protein SdpB family protein [Kineococcus sp. LSe6-4]|uniref:Sporulation-delaying protein SdpB family protein n=1 Tax=Kineococcus halophytocola TaxID=3234027 RepID=A0ABV4H615_9ACTN
MSATPTRTAYSILPKASGALRRVSDGIAWFDVRTSRNIAWARSLIAVAQLSILVFTPANFLFVPVGTEPAGPSCNAYNAWTAYCALDEFDASYISWALVAGLILVISGFWPRVTGILHVWVTFSISTAIQLPDGGEAAAQVVTVFFALILLSDNRRNHWIIDTSSRKTSTLTPISWAASWGLRLQIFWIYISASVAKFSVPEWQEGSAIYYVARQVFFGVDGPLEGLLLWATSQPLLSLAITWGTMIGEIAIAILVLLPYRVARFSLVLTMVFHGGIILVIGLWSFGLIMIASVLGVLASRPTVVTVSLPPRGSAPTVTQSRQDQVSDSRL